jgi:hypothetical protein
VLATPLNIVIPGSPNLDFSKGIKDEHCSMWGFNVASSFTSSNYGLTTTPQKEYKISTGMQLCPEEDMKDKKRQTCSCHQANRGAQATQNVPEGPPY